MSQNLSLPETKHENPHSPHRDWLDKFIEYKLRGSSIEIRNTLLVCSDVSISYSFWAFGSTC